MKKLLISAAILSLSTMVMAADTRVFVPGSAIPDEIPNENVDLLLHLNVLGMFDFDVATTLTFVNAADIYCFDMSHEAAYNMGSIISGTLTAYCPDATEPLVGEYVLPVPYDWSNNPETPPVGPDLLFEPLGTCGGTAGVVEQPVEFALADAYPNPFNPTTTIEFSLENAGMTTLKVYNLAGQEVATLVNGNMERGAHQVTFDASALSSGMYLYSIEAEGFTATKKMALIK